MTDTLITVDVSSAALISRAREGQAVARKNLLRVERERQERARQEKARRERLDREQADRLGRSRLRKGGKREEVAAGYVQQYMLAQAFWQVIEVDGPTGQLTPPWQDRITHKVWSQDGQSSITLETTRGADSTGREYGWGYTIFPAGKESIVGLFYTYYPQDQPTPGVIRPAALIGQPQCFYADRRQVRITSSQPTADISRLLFAEAFPATPETIGHVLGSEDTSGAPFDLRLTGSYEQNTITGRIYSLSALDGPGRPASWANKSYRVANEDPVKYPDVTYTPPDFSGFQLGSQPFVAWDWGKPQLCRRLLLQLGFRPEDLRP